LRSLVPLTRDLGLHAAWYTLPPDSGFFTVTKHFHNGLQGGPGELAPRHRQIYADYLERLAGQMRGMDADVWIIHDPQPLALRELVPLRGGAIWRCHIDCSTPNPGVRDYLLPWVHTYDRVLFSMPEYTLPDLLPEQVRTVYPAIDPLAAKHRPRRSGRQKSVLEGLGIDSTRPLVSQVSRFDPWKNPWQVVDVYRRARREIPSLQLAMAGVFAAKDDPEGPRMYRAIREYVGSDPDVHLFTDPARVGWREINALQSGSSVVLQRSAREGFGLTVTEAMWKGRPVVGTPVGGIKAQIRHAENGFLVDTTTEFAELVVRLVRDRQRAKLIGEAARRSVRERFLLPRLLADELRSYAELVQAEVAARLVA
jgi:trehalose synthase